MSADPTMRWTVRLPTADAPEIVLTSYDDGTTRVRHTCLDGHRPAPALSEAHTVTQDDKGPTVTPSILCSECGLHGFVTDGVWTDA